MISGDALWNPRYHEEGLIDAFDINELEVAQHLYPLAREFEIWTVPEGYLGFPFGWSPVQVYYNPKFVDPAPDSWEVFSIPSTRAASCWRTSRSRSRPTWARSAALPTPTT